MLNIIGEINQQRKVVARAMSVAVRQPDYGALLDSDDTDTVKDLVEYITSSMEKYYDIEQQSDEEIAGSVESVINDNGDNQIHSEIDAE